ncbi:hypothetical protein Tco_0067025 [Tanacetum coccineum]
MLPRILKPRFASQVDVNNDLLKSVTTHYLPKEKESAVVKPYHMIAPGSSRYSSNDMVHNQYLEEAKKKRQESGRNSRPSVMPFARSQSTANGSKPKPRINNQKSRNWLATKTSYVTTKTVPIAEHSRNSRNFSDSKHFVCSTCQKCIFNANHDHCVTKFLNEVNSRAKVPSNKTTNKNKLVEQTSVAKKIVRQIPKGHWFSIKKTSVVHEKKYNDSELCSCGKTDGYSLPLVQVVYGVVDCTLLPSVKNNSYIMDIEVFTVMMENPALSHITALGRTPHVVNEIGSAAVKPCQEDSFEFYLRHSRIKDKTSANSDIKDLSSETNLVGRLLKSFQDDEKYEHVGQDTRSQGGKEDKDKQGKDLKISNKDKVTKERAQDQRSHNMKEHAYNKDKDQEQDSRTQC